uniref:Selenocysteine lyase n=1 Tax=Denticeps clupeoides TaxID=299321 RepID=A0AAY4EQK0_9TELE
TGLNPDPPLSKAPSPHTAPRAIYMDYNATTPLEPEVVEVVSEALRGAWGNPSSSYLPGVKARNIINKSRENVARMVGGRAEDIVFTSGGTEANSLVFHTAAKHFWESQRGAERERAENCRQNGTSVRPHFIISNVEHDSVRLTAENMQTEGRADVTCVAVSKVTGRVEVEDVVAALRPATCLISIMMANNETGVIMPIKEICQRVRSISTQRHVPRILLHTDAAQAIGKVRVDARDLGVDYLTIVGHKFYAPRIGALFVNGPGNSTPLYPMLFGGGQERNFRPGSYLEDRLLAVFGKERIRFNSHFPGSETLPNTCNVSIIGPGLQGRRVLSTCRRLLASVGAACHSDRGDRPSHILLSCGVPFEVASNALRISVGRGTSLKDVDLVVEDLRETARKLEEMN